MMSTFVGHPLIDAIEQFKEKAIVKTGVLRKVRLE